MGGLSDAVYTVSMTITRSTINCFRELGRAYFYAISGYYLVADARIYVQATTSQDFSIVRWLQGDTSLEVYIKKLCITNRRAKRVCKKLYVGPCL